MWRKPSLEKPDFKKANLEELSVNESIVTNGGATDIKGIAIPPVLCPIKPPIILTGIVAPKFDFLEPVKLTK